MNFLRFLLVLSLAIWVGALVFLPFVAQISFSQLPSPHLAGIVVRGSLIGLHWLGLICGGVFLISSLLGAGQGQESVAPFRPSHVIVVLMMALTAISQFRIIPKMDALRAAVDDIGKLSTDNPIRQQFGFLHVTSMRVEEAVLLLGIVLLYLTTRRLSSAERT